MQRKQVNIISLGEIVKPDLTKTITAFVELIEEKTKQEKSSIQDSIINNVIFKNNGLIERFKLGEDENEFTNKMIKALEEATHAKITVEEFNQAWCAMCPKFKSFEDALNEAIELNKQQDQSIIFISSTNPKDIRHLINELNMNNIPHVIINNKLISIDGIPLHTTYTNKIPKAKLLPLIKNALSPKLFFNHVDNDIKYITSDNLIIHPPILKNNLDVNNQEIKEMSKKLKIEMLYWDKTNKLIDALSNAQKTANKK